MTLTSHLIIITFHVANIVTRTATLRLNNGYIYNLPKLHNCFVHILKMALNYNIVTLAIIVFKLWKHACHKRLCCFQVQVPLTVDINL